MRILLTGGTGFVGTSLTKALKSQGHETVLLTRRDVPAPGAALAPHWLDGVDAIINMAGESIAGGRWTPSYKQKIRDSRILLTQTLAEACTAAAANGQTTPKVLVSFSAVGYYGTHPTQGFDEQSPAGDSWLCGVARDWEAAAAPVASTGVRLVLLRLGVVLGPGGFLARLATPFRLYIGGPAGAGTQPISWIHRDDVVAVVSQALTDATMQGPYNLTAPQPATMDEMASAIGAALQRPSWLRTPALPLRLLFGEMADELILNGQRVLPSRLQLAGYQFKFPELRAAVRSSFAEK
jgi:hypothetical protein